MLIVVVAILVVAVAGALLGARDDGTTGSTSVGSDFGTRSFVIAVIDSGDTFGSITWDEPAVLQDGRSRVLGHTDDGLTLIDVIGPEDGIQEIQVVTQASQAGRGGYIVGAFAPEGTDWAVAEVDKLAPEDGEIERDFGDHRVRITNAIQTLGSLTVVVAAD